MTYVNPYSGGYEASLFDQASLLGLPSYGGGGVNPYSGGYEASIYQGLNPSAVPKAPSLVSQLTSAAPSIGLQTAGMAAANPVLRTARSFFPGGARTAAGAAATRSGLSLGGALHGPPIPAQLNPLWKQAFVNPMTRQAWNAGGLTKWAPLAGRALGVAGGLYGASQSENPLSDALSLGIAGAQLGSLAGPWGTAIGGAGGALIGATGLDEAFFGMFGGDDEKEETVGLRQELTALGADPAETRRLIQVYNQLQDAGATPEEARELLAPQVTAIRNRLISGETMNDRLMLQTMASVMKPYRDTALENIETAHQSAMKAGQPEVANQYFAMSKNVANAYAAQALTLSTVGAGTASATAPGDEFSIFNSNPLAAQAGP